MSKCEECKHLESIDEYGDVECQYGFDKCKHYPIVKRDLFEPKKPKKWVPNKGRWCIDDSMKIIDSCSVYSGDVVHCIEYLNIFNRDTEQQAEDLVNRLKQLAKLHAWAGENDYLKEWVEGEHNCYVVFDSEYENWVTHSHHTLYEIFQVYMTKEGAEKTAEALNSGMLCLD